MDERNAQAYNDLGKALWDKGRCEEATAAFRRAIALEPEFAEAHNNLGNALCQQGLAVLAIDVFRRAIALQPDDVQAHYNLGEALRDRGQLDEAIAAFHQAITLKPDFSKAHNSLGIVLKDQGRLDEALACFRRADELEPDVPVAASNVLVTLNYHPGYDSRAILAELRRWDQRFAAPFVKTTRPHSNEPDPDRRLRIGYVSPDFRSHPVGRFMLPLLEAHDHEHHEVRIYSNLSHPDAITHRCRALADAWRDVADLSDEQLADVIRQDEVDILVDLSMHSAGNRMLVFARNPAPVQVTYLAYCGSTGLGAMHYRLTDPFLDPPGSGDGDYTERTVRLPRCYWCFQPPEGTPPVSRLPALGSGLVTFGCLNNLCKVSGPTLDAWARLLQAMPESRLVLHAHAGSHRDRVQSFLARRGVAPERLSFLVKVPTLKYLRFYERFDVGLDPFPCGGGTTTCDALWMGVPVITLAGQTAVGRAGTSLLSNVGLPELVAHDVSEYVTLAMDLAQDLPRLAELRSTLRARMQRSPLMDAPGFARDVEAAFRSMWINRCEQTSPS